ncbi:hypothetical protein IOD16_15250 [Saccharothrix sp. 6-C]|uniref:Uncharacterized protein n=1 Tax=Saccharothrix texasensis TaxID=103734 RepID=A0A3N1GY19_9PSEU|nr:MULTISPECIES: hypothetical protein [Saccharothrix]QQQ79628.1 hypothetical protein IOD16_15250 [Saccharothrix sp. 6-C]ROP35175.1 hypothetical protein EDD40_0396 [Saccharothrix texasensis]
MSSTPIYDELAAILLADHPGTADAAAAGQPQAESADDASKQVRAGGRRRKPEPDA